MITKRRDKFNRLFDLCSLYKVIFYMDFHSKTVLALAIFSLTLLVNLPFGYYRKRTRKYSFKWFLYIHLPIPLIFLARVLSHLDFRYIPLFVLAAILGQIAGGKLEL